MKDNFDVIVIGGGAIGLATANELGKFYASTLVLEKYSFLNQEGSSSGFSRQYRIPYPEPYMVDMALKSRPKWHAFEEQAETQLLDRVGTLWFGDPTVHSTEGNIIDAEKSLNSLKVKFRSLNYQQVEEQFNFKNLPSNYLGLFQEDGASINFAQTLESLLMINRNHPTIELKDHSPVLKIERKQNVFYVSTKFETYKAPKLVIAPGPYINEVLNLLKFEIKVTYWEMSSAYFKKLSPTVQYPTWFVFQNPVKENGNQFYGFPSVSWDYPEFIRVAPDFVIKPLTDPSQRTGKPNLKELEFTVDWIRNHMTGIETTPCYASTCLIALSNIKNKELVLDFAPPYIDGHSNIIVYGTGWAAKFAPLLGTILSDLALTGKTSYDIKPFQLGYKYFNSIV